MNRVTIAKNEYERLIEAKLKYEYLRQVIEEDIFSPPPTKNIKEVIKAFKETGEYNAESLKSLERGLKRSPYFRRG